MKKTIVSLLLALAALSASAWTTEHATTNGFVALTNRELTAAWTPTAVHVVYPSGKTGTVAIARIAHDVRVPLAAASFTNAAVVSWIPEIDATIRPREVLAITSTVPTCTIQLDRRAGQ